MMIELVDRIRHAIVGGRYSSETAIREAAVLPILRYLGWDDLDPDRVIREYTLGSRRVDYALSAIGHKPTVLIEVKTAGTTFGGDRQLFEYAFHEGVPLAILTNGQEWNFYLPGAAGSYEERLVYKIDLVERENDVILQRFVRYLSFERVRSGAALDDAQRDYKDLHSRRIVNESIPKAWAQLINEPDELLVELLAERTASVCGFRADPEAIELFLSNQGHAPAAPRQTAATAFREMPITHQPLAPSHKVEGSKLDYHFRGRDKTVRHAIDVVIEVLRELASENGDFLVRFEARARGRSRNHIARKPDLVYPGRPQLTKYVIDIAPGWYLGTNIANREKLRLLRIACETAGLSFGKDLRVSFPNADQ